MYQRSLARLIGFITITVLASVVTAQSAAPAAIRVTASVSNISGASLEIDHPLLNGKSNAKPIVTQMWTGVYNPHPVGVSYSPATKRWQIVNEDGAAMPVDANFNVLIAPTAKVHHASALNSLEGYTITGLQKNNQDGWFQFTHRINPNTLYGGMLSAKAYGIHYLIGGGRVTTVPRSNRWAVFTEDRSNMEATSFHILDVTKLRVGGQLASFPIISSPANTEFNRTVLNHPLTNDKPNAMLFVTHITGPSYNGASPTLLNKSIGVYYEDGKWRIFNQDNSPGILDCAYIVTVLPGVAVWR